MMKRKINRPAMPKEDLKAFGISTGGSNLDTAMKRAKASGTMNLQGRGLTTFPEDICNFS